MGEAVFRREVYEEGTRLAFLRATRLLWRLITLIKWQHLRIYTKWTISISRHQTVELDLEIVATLRKPPISYGLYTNSWIWICFFICPLSLKFFNARSPICGVHYLNRFLISDKRTQLFWKKFMEYFGK